MKKINVVLTALYIAGFAVSLCALYQLPTHLVQNQIIGLTQNEQVQPVLDRLYGMIGVPLLIGAAAVIGLWLERRSTDVPSASSESVHEPTPSQATPAGESEEVLETSFVEKIVNDDVDEVMAFTQALSQICHRIEASQATAYRAIRTEEYAYLEMFASYAYHAPEGEAVTYRFGEGLAGQVAKRGERIVIDAIPEGYIEIFSGLGKATPTHLMILPVKYEEEVVGVVEVASFRKFTLSQVDSLQLAFDRLALKLSNSDNVSLAEATS